MGFLSDIGKGITGAVGGFLGSGGNPLGAIVGGVGGLLGAKEGSKGQVTQAATPKWITDQAQLGFKNLNSSLAGPATSHVAGFSPDQLAAQQAIRGAQGLGASDLLAIQSTMKGLAGGIDPAAIAKFMNPYESSVVDALQADMMHGLAMNNVRVNSEAEAAGAFGGDRQGVYDAVLDANTMRDTNAQLANLRYSGYNNAVQNAFQNHQLQFAGNEALANLINQRRGNAYTDAGALAASGAMQQAYQQSLLDFPRQAALDQINAANSMIGGQGAQSQIKTGGGFGGALTGFLGGVQTANDIAGALGGIFGGGGADPRSQYMADVLAYGDQTFGV